MQVITEPTIHVFSTQTFHPIPDYPIPSDGDDATKIGAFAAKGCYDSYGVDGRKNEANQRALKEHRHGSVFEHVVVGLYLTGVTRALTLEMNRHRQFAISQRSTRYTAEEDASIVLDPYYARLYEALLSMKETSSTPVPAPLTIEEHILIADFLSSCQDAFSRYQSQVEMLVNLNPLQLEGFDLRKWARGKARNILPHALETRVAYTANLRAWRWFIEARSDKHAEPEIRRVADLVLRTLRGVCPIYVDDYVCVEVYDGIPVWKTSYPKV